MIDFAKLLGLLVDNQVAFIIIGGVAAVIHGSGRLTQDLDVVYQRTPENLMRVTQALADHSPYLRGAPPGLPFRWSAATLLMGLNFTLETDLGSIDLLGEIPGGGGYDDLLAHSFEVDVFSLRCRCLELSALIRAKRAAGRPKDLEAIAELELIWQRERE